MAGEAQENPRGPPSTARPHADTFPLATDHAELSRLATRASDPERHQLTPRYRECGRGIGVDTAASVVLLAGGDEGDSIEPLPGPAAEVVLFLDRCDDDPALFVALARGLVAVTRWCQLDSLSAVRARVEGEWDRWQLAREVPLG